MKVRRICTLLFLIALAPAYLSAVEGAELKELIYLPPDFYVGDRVEMRAILSPLPGMRLLPPREIPVVSWIDIHDVQVVSKNSSWEVRITFTPYAAGTRTFPSLDLGDVTFSEVKIHTVSILQERGYEFFGIKDQLFLPGTRLTLALAVSILLFGPLLILSFTGRVRRKIRRFMALHVGRRPYKRLLKTLKDLKEKNLHMSSRRFYIVLSEEFRGYLSARTNRDFLTITSSEIGEHLGNTFPEHKKEQIEELVQMMRQGDLIKFGGVNAPKKQREIDLQIVADIASELEAYVESERQQTEMKALKHKRTKQA